MKRIITLALFLTMMPSLFAQHVDYDNDSKWFLGLNVGGTWNTTDVNDKVDIGYGFILGRSFNSNYGRRLSFDLRLRYLHGMWYGQDYDTTDLTNYSPAYMPSQLESYQSTYGYTVNNFQTEVHELGLELALHANRLRERSGWDPYIFGGVNIAWNQTYSNLVQNDSSFTGGSGMYDYSDPTAVNQAFINGTLDGTYDTPMNQGSVNGDWNADFVPSLGFGIGYYFGPRFSVGLEHKTSWARKNDWDGFEGSDTKWGFPNDLYHYSGGYLRFHFRGGGRTIVEPEPNPTPVAGVVPCDDPIVRFIRPSSNGIEVDQQIFALRAKITRVGGRENIVLRVNGIESTNFFYNENSNELQGNIVLKDGLNNIQVVASNGCGSDVEDITINYVTCKDPIVKFINPSHNNFHVDQANYVVSASVANGTSVTYTVNGAASSNFHFNANNGSFESNIVLREGNNTITITSTNACGTDTETINIIFTDCEDPHIDFLIGNGSTISTDLSVANISAYVHGVDNKNAIGFRVNGSNKPFSFNASNNLLQASVTLNPGQNTIQITSGNDCGTDTETITVLYNPCIDPTVNIITPSISNSTSTNGTVLVKATVTNATSVNQIQMYVNGVAISGGTYAPNTHIFSQNAPLNAGLNTIQVVVTNDCGSDTETITINYTAPCPDPIVSLVSNTSVVNSASLQLQAAIQNITSASQVNVTVNGLTDNSGSYNPTTHVYTNNIVLQNGVNNIVITATNSCGTDNITYVVTYREPCDNPVISMINPMSSPLQSATPIITVQSSVLGVTSASQIHMTVNGIVDANGAYNSLTHIYQNGVNLQSGSNTIVISATNSCGTVTETIVVNYSPCLEPIVSFIAPTVTTTQNNSTIVQASVQNVSNVNQIQLLVNGSTVQGSFNSLTGLFQSNVALQQGANVIQIVATNDCGNDVEMKTIVYSPCLDPTINIISPTSVSTQNNSVNVQATVMNVTSASQVQMTVNGSTVSGSYNTSTHVFSGNVSLQAGSNIISITATNSCGSVSQTIAIRYDEPCDPPTVNILSPLSGVSTNNGSTQLTATVSNVTSASQITATLNGAAISGGSYNQATNTYTATVALQGGSNSIVVSATNSCGSDSKSVLVRYSPPCDVPVVTMIAPVAGLTINNAGVQVSATVLNVTSASQISATLNGAAILGGSYNSTTHVYTANVTLIQGGNTIIVSATNTCGTDSKSVQATYNKPCNMPVVNITAPSSGTTTTNASVILTATVTTVTSANQITATLNGVPINGGMFNPSSNIYSVPLTLQSGVNTIVVSGTNDCGTDSKTVTVTYNPPCDAPSVSITAPSAGQEFTGGMTTLMATITNVSVLSEISVNVNGVAVTNGSFNPSTNVYQAMIGLQNGSNSISVSATNNCGTDSESISVTRDDPNTTPEPTMVICHHPPGNPSNTQQLTIPVSAWPAHQAHGDTQGPCPEPEPEPTMVICHHPPGNPSNTQQLTIPASAWAAHQAHGDTQGACPEPEPDPEMVICHHLPGDNAGTEQMTILTSEWAAHEAHGDTQGACPEDPIQIGGPGELTVGNNTITICHHPPGNPENTQQLEIPLSAWAAHEAHGDVLGPCQEPGTDLNNQGSGTGTGLEGTGTGTDLGTGTIGNVGGNNGGLTTGSGTQGTGTQGTGTGTQGTGTQGTGNGNGNGNGTGNGNGGQNKQGAGDQGSGKTQAQKDAEATAKAKAEEAAKLKAQEAAKAKAAAEAKLKAQQAEKAKADADAKRKAEEAAKAKAAQEEAKRKAEEAAKVKAQQAEKAKADADAKRKAEEAAKAKAAQEEAKRKAEEAAKVKAQQAEKAKADADAKRKAEEAAKAKAAQEEAKRKAEEAAKVKAQQAAKAKAAAEAKRKAEEAAKAKAAQEEAKRKAEEAAKVKAQQAEKAKADADAKRKAEEAAKAKAAADAAAKKKAAAEAAKKKAAEAAKAKAAADAAAKKKAAEEAAKKKAEEEKNNQRNGGGK